MPKKKFDIENVADAFLSGRAVQGEKSKSKPKQTPKAKKQTYEELPFYIKPKDCKFMLNTWKELIAPLKILAKSKRKSCQALINDLLIEYIEREENAKFIELYKEEYDTEEE